MGLISQDELAERDGSRVIPSVEYAEWDEFRAWSDANPGAPHHLERGSEWLYYRLEREASRKAYLAAGYRDDWERQMEKGQARELAWKGSRRHT